MTKQLLLITGLILGVATVAQAQNYSNYSPNQPQQFETTSEYKTGGDLLQEEDLKQLLISEGVPLSQDPNLLIGEVSQYTLGPADVINISVERHPEVSGQFAINNEGKIQYGFVGDVKLAGFTKQEATDVIVEALSKYIITPQVTMVITGYNSKVVYVVGEVGRPGKIFMRGDTITIREALIQANLPLLSGNTKKSLLITPTDDGSPIQQRVNVHGLLVKGDLRENLVMKPGDTLYIPPTIFARALRVIQPVAAPIGASEPIRRTGTGGL